MKYVKLKKRTARNYTKYTIELMAFLFIFMGFALAQSRLNIRGTGGIAKVNWSVFLDNLVVDDGSITADEAAVINEVDKTSVSFSITFNGPSEYYEFEADIVNDGTIDAMVGNISLTGVPENLKPYITYMVTYGDDHEINLYESLLAGTSERIKVLVKFNENADLESIFGIDGVDKITFDLLTELRYVQATEDLITRSKSVSLNEKILLHNIPEVDSVVDFTKVTTVISNQGLMVRSGTAEAEFPIYYYRGNVTNNNVIFAGFCWKIVRTTETGGTKLIYNGTIGTGNTCKGAYVYLSYSYYNSSYSSEKYIGYTYDINTTSTIKTVIDNWYEENIESEINNKHYGKYLEDTVWCNDRTYGAVERLLGEKISPSLACPQNSDKYTVYKSNGNGLLKYPIALLTADEIILAGAHPSADRGYYLNSGSTYFWLMSPKSGSTTSAIVFIADPTGRLNSGNVGVSSSVSSTNITNKAVVRPALSLSYKTKVKDGGDGTANNPYVVE